jgi:hypothetical protein
MGSYIDLIRAVMSAISLLGSFSPGQSMEQACNAFLLPQSIQPRRFCHWLLVSFGCSDDSCSGRGDICVTFHSVCQRVVKVRETS